MFTDWTEALDAEGLPLAPNTIAEQTLAARTVARHARDDEDLALLLTALGLPAAEHTATGTTTTSTEGALTVPDTLSAFEATALSMHAAGHSTAQIIEATGVTNDELTALTTAREHQLATTVDTATTGDGTVERLLAWAEASPQASVRAKAARVRSDLAYLTDRQAADAETRAAEQRVADARAELARAERALRAVKSKTTTRTTAAPAPTPISEGSSKAELAAIRTWARGAGHTVADSGKIPNRILAAYDAAHPAGSIRKAV
ncbi:histone-like nucleoid-structuring protein Lsr2 [Streptomyces sp. NPDC057426]|uniref:Lsr2 family DNA-binding protein n=1 Tax=Streptomyces sp. NPDC057426 TaxID=3346128 RepID=UPI0036A8FB2C